MKKNSYIVHVSAYYPPHLGGLERVAQVIATTLSREQDILVITSDVGATSGVTRESNLEVRRLKSFEAAHTPFAPTLLWHLLTLPKRSLIHFHLSQAYWPELVLFVSKLRGIPYLVHFHLDVEPSGRLGLLFKLYKAILWGPFLRQARAVIAFSQEQSQLLQSKYRVKAENIHLIPNGVSDEYFSSEVRAVPTTLELLYVGRLALQKRVERLIEAMALVTVPAHLTIMGDGDQRPMLEDMVRSKGVKNITFAGYANAVQVREQYWRSHALLISSDREGMPLTILEAMAGGLPIVGSNVSGIRELITGTGVLVEQPYPEGFAMAIDSLYKNSVQRAELSHLSVQKAREYAWPDLVAKIETLYTLITP